MAEEYGVAHAFVFGYIGTHGMAHALGNILDAADRLRHEPQIRFLFVGDGAERQGLIESAARRGLKNVVFAAPVAKEQMPDIWSLCDVALVHLKNADVFRDVIPSKMFEAMAMAVPILLVAPGGEASQILADDQAGLHVPAGQPQALSEAVVTLANDPKRRSELAHAALKAASGHTRERQAEDMLRVLELAAAGQGHRAGIG